MKGLEEEDQGGSTKIKRVEELTLLNLPLL